MLCISNFGWAKPVSVNFYNFTNYRKGLFLVSLAGPMANFIMAFLSYLLVAVLHMLGLLSIELYKVLMISYQLNLCLFIFNLLPIPPLDGSKILMSILPDKHTYFLERLEQYGVIILMLLVVTDVIDPIFRPLLTLLDIIIKSLISLIM